MSILTAEVGYLIVQCRASARSSKFAAVIRSRDILKSNFLQYHNLIPSIMATKGLDLKTAIEYGGELVKNSLARFLACKAALPSWSENIDRDVATLVQGCEDWIIANSLWSFETERYFGPHGAEVKKTLQVVLLPPRYRPRL